MPVCFILFILFVIFKWHKSSIAQWNSPHLEKLGIKYVTFTYQPQDAEVRSMPPVKDTLGFFIFKRTEP